MTTNDPERNRTMDPKAAPPVDQADYLDTPTLRYPGKRTAAERIAAGETRELVPGNGAEYQRIRDEREANDA